MAFNPANYPPDWKAISRQIRERAGNCCETCGAPNGEVIVRDRRNPMRWRVVSGMEIEIAKLDGEWVTKIVLTVHHRCQCDKRACRDLSHLVCLCQLHHLAEDREHHLAVQRRNREAKKRVLQPPLLEVA